MSIQEVGPVAPTTAPPLSSAKLFPRPVEDADDRGRIRSEPEAARTEVERFDAAPWGARPALVLAGDPHESRFTRMLHSVDRLALGLVYLAVLSGLPLAAVALVTGAA